MIKIFVAYPIRNTIAEELLNLPSQNTSLNKIRWTPKDNLHITLFFIGEVEEQSLNAIKNELAAVFKNQQSFSLEFESIILKGNKSKPSMIWAQFKKNEEFSKLCGDIYQSVRKFMTIDPAHKDPIPHCTLARIKPGADLESINIDIEISDPIIEINTAELWQTVQTKEGIRYESLQKISMNN